MGEAVDKFGVRLAIATGGVTLLIGAFIAIKDALSKTKEGQEGLSKATEALNKVLSPLFAILEQVGLAVLPIITKGFEALGAVMNKVAKFFGVSNDKIKEVQGSLQKNNEYATKLAEEEKERLAAIQKKKDEDAAKHKDYLAKKKAADDKAAADRKKAAEEEAKKLDAANKVLTEAYVATLAQRDQDIFNAGLKQNERLLALEKAGIKDKSAVLEQGRLEVAAINKKYDDEEAKKLEDKKKQDDDEAKKKAEEDKAKADAKRDDLLLGVETQLQFDAMSYDQRKQLINEKEALLLTDSTLTENQKTAIQKAAAAERKNIDEAALQAKIDIQSAELDLVGQFGSFLKEIAGKNKKLAIAGIIVEQAASIGKIVANTGIANAKAVAASPLTAGMPWVAINSISAGLSIASSVAGAAKAIQQVNSSDNATAAPSAGGAVSALSANIGTPQVASMSAPQIQGTQAATPGQQIASTLSQTTNKPVKAYVVSGEVSSQQALDRRTSVAATFGG